MEFISNYPWYYTLLCLIAGFVFAGILYYKDKHNVNRTKSLLLLLFSFRFLSVSLIAILLLDIFIKHTTYEDEKPIIIFAQDNSSSILSNKDSNYIKSNYINDIDNLLENISEKYEVKKYIFDSETDINKTIDFKGKETNISKLFSDIENNYANRNVGSIIIASDGIYNKGSNPIYIKQNSNINCIALGDTTPQKDVWIQNIVHNQVAYLGNTFPVEVTINATDLNQKKINVAINKDGKTIKSETITINTKSFTKTINFALEAEKSGVQKYSIVISKLNEDINPANNSQSFLIDIIDNRDKILILASSPHPDISALQQCINNSQTYEVEIEYISSFNKPLKPYSLVIFHQIQSLPNSIINDLKNNSISYWLIGNIAPSPLIISETKNSGNRFNDVEPYLQENFVLFNLSDELKKFIREFPAVKCNFGNVKAPNGSSSLLNQKIGSINTESPLFYFNEVNSVKNAIFNGDGIWKWRLRDFGQNENHLLFNELILKTVQYLSVKADKSFFRVYSKKIVNENEDLDFTAEVYNQSYELITEPDVTINLKDENNKQYAYTFSKKEKIYKLNAGKLSPGEYTYVANVKIGDKSYTKNGAISIREMVAEKINTVANHQLLYQLAKENRGNLYYPDQLAELQKSILSDSTIKTITYSQKTLNDLINLKWIFFIILALLSMEWFLRKQNGKM